MRHARNCGAEWFKWLRPAAAGLIKVSHLTYFLGDSDLSVHSQLLAADVKRDQGLRSSLINQ